MDLIQAIKIIEKEMIRYNYSHETPCRLLGFPATISIKIMNLFSKKVDRNQQKTPNKCSW